MGNLLLNIRDCSPCYGCTMEWKAPGCHDTCPNFADWTAEKERVKGNRKAWEKAQRRQKF